MEVRRITAQLQSLEDHYFRLANDPRVSSDYAEVGRRMLELLRLLPAIGGAPMWAVTSHADLHLVATDDYRQQSLVTVRGGGSGDAFSFCIEYPVPNGEAPWPGTRMLLSTHDAWQACEMIAYSLRKTTGAAYSCHKQAEQNAAADPAA
ncbi:hypothetical protein [Fimbriiglobus ruber]|uniref:hypothetical protein n=1 Tax=Fimbriiglobus ruber TaxID=1908690 RepID=UPI001179B46B|nr:hypothetical protein [Fimbriiglobus ruber]